MTYLWLKYNNNNNNLENVLDDEKRDTVIKDMNNASSYFRTELAKRLDLRVMPEIKFVYDESIEYGKHIEDIIEKINNEDK